MKKIIYVTIAVGAIFLSCKKDDSTTGTAPKKKITRADLYPENGYISGTIVSSSSNNAFFEKQFKHQLDQEMATYFVNAKGNYIIHLNKLDKYGRIGENDKRTDMSFILSSDKVSIKAFDDFHSSIYIDSSATTITKFNIDSDGSQSITLSNTVFNTVDGTFVSDYVITVRGGATSSAKDATITGKINTTLTNIRYRTGSSL